MKKIFRSGVFLAFSMLFCAQAISGGIDVKVYNPQQNSVFPVLSTLLTGDKEAILVDAKFQKNDAKKLVSIIQASRKKLTTIFISHSDPDYYFGLDVILEHFPDAKVVSTAQTAYLIAETKDDKLRVWKDILKENAPQKLITPQSLTKNKLSLEGNDILIQRNKTDPSHIFLWVPSIRAVLGGVSVFDGMHVWTADTQGKQEYQNWKQKLDEMKKLSPKKVIPGHYLKNNEDFSSQSIDFTRQYISDFESVAKNSETSVQLIAAMDSKYKSLQGQSNLEMSAKVAKNEIPWIVKHAFPSIGNTLEVKFGDTVFELTFHDNKRMSFIGTSGLFKGVKGDVTYRAVEVVDHVYMVYWCEPSIGSNVVHVEDFNTGIIYTNIAAKDGSFTHMKGSFTVR